MAKAMKEDGVIFHLDIHYKAVEGKDDGKHVLVSEDGQVVDIVVDEILVATGRKPNVEVNHPLKL